MKKILRKLITYLFEDVVSRIIGKIENTELALSESINYTRFDIDTLHSNVDKLIDRCEDIQIDYLYTSTYEDLQSMYDLYLKKIHYKNRHNLRNGAQTIEDLIQLYDKMLYKSTDLIHKSSINLTHHLILMKELRYMILNIIFNSDGTFEASTCNSFYLYMIDTSVLRNNLLTMPIINTDKFYMVDNVNNIKYVGDKYVTIHLARTGIEIVTPVGTFSMGPKYYRTVLRVFYSIYMDKFYLYRLQENR